MAYNEIEQRGTEDFPLAFFHLDANHSRYNMSAHWHSEIELIRILDGEFLVTLNNNTYTAKKGDIIFVNSETVHQGVPKNCVYECVVFHADFLYSDAFDSHSFVKSLLDREYIVNEYFPRGAGEAQKSLNDIFESLVSASHAHKFRVISAFYNFFAAVAEDKLYSHKIGNNAVLSNKNIVKLKKILSFLRGNYDKPVSLEMIAENVRMSSKYLGSFFKNMTGKTPIEYLNEYRVEKAAHKLRCSDLSVTEIAFSCGFSDLSYFIKTFKTIKGVSPGKFRNM